MSDGYVTCPHCEQGMYFEWDGDAQVFVIECGNEDCAADFEVVPDVAFDGRPIVSKEADSHE